jgi:hypothetical protein
MLDGFSPSESVEMLHRSSNLKSPFVVDPFVEKTSGRSAKLDGHVIEVYSFFF